MYVSIREASLKGADYKSITEGLKALGLDTVELEFYRDYTVWAPDRWEKLQFTRDTAARIIREAFPDRGIGICAFLLHNNFNCDDPQAEVNWVIDVVNTAAAMHIPAIRIDAITKGERDEPFEVRVTRFVDSMKKVIAATADTNVSLGIENHGVQGNDPAFLHEVIRRVGSARLGVNMDTGNFYWNGYPLEEVYSILESVAPNTKHTHVKNICYPEDRRSVQRESGWEYATYVSPIDEGDIDHARVVSILKKVGYEGPLTIEDECLHKFDAAGRKQVLENDVAYLRGLLG